MMSVTASPTRLVHYFRPLFLYSFACKWINHLFHYLTVVPLSFPNMFLNLQYTVCKCHDVSFFLNIYIISELKMKIRGQKHISCVGTQSSTLDEFMN